MNQSNLDLTTKVTGPVECLGQKFPSEEARREHYLKLLAQKLKDPEFRKIEGFPIGKDEDILALSDPPYYTACPNPWLGEFIKGYGTPYDPKQPYHREPFAADVSEGKNHPIYNAHPYHTKVPHRAIMKYILHYTQPGDVVFDAFAGTGMTGVAAQFCGDRIEVQALGYRVLDDGTILNEDGKPFSKLGARRAILNDLSPAATFIAYNYNAPIDANNFEHNAKKVFSALTAKCICLYSTLHGAKDEDIAQAVRELSLCKTLDDCGALLKDAETLKARIGRPQAQFGIGQIHFSILSDLFSCPECAKTISYWDEAVGDHSSKVKESFECPHCKAILNREKLDRKWVNQFDPRIGETVSQKAEQIVSVSYSISGSRIEKPADDFDRALLKKCEELVWNSDFPAIKVPDGDKTVEPIRLNYTHLHHFYSPRNLITLLEYQSLAREFAPLLMCLTGVAVSVTKMYRWTPDYEGGGPLTGTLYFPSIVRDISTIDAIKRFMSKLPKVHRSKSTAAHGNYLLSTMSATSGLGSVGDLVDYVFIDPPFGANKMYSELSFIWEAWLRVLTNNKQEAIQNLSQKKGLNEYRQLMEDCFRQCYRVLKPGRWMTVEFSNTKSAVWNAIQTTLQEAGFVVANVSLLDKKQLQFNAINSSVSVKQDLVISAYKPNGGLEERFLKRGQTEEGVWDFTRTHLKNLPVAKAKRGQIEPISERDPRFLYDRMVAFYVGHSTPVPMSSAEFQAGLAEKFPERDGMVFLPEQVNEYDKKRAQVENIGQLAIFVEDERSAINWLRNFLKKRPSTSQDINPEFMQQLGASWKKWEARPEMSALLDQNFLCHDGAGEVPSQIHSYLSTQFKELRNLPKDHAQLNAKAKHRWYVPDPKKNIDVETLRNKRLLEEFWSYLPEGYTPPALSANKGQTLPGLTVPRPKIPKGKKIKELRTEAIRVGFKHCYQQKDYATILVVAEMIPDNVLNEDEQLQMIYDTAITRSGGA